jgi:hypothetical protein
MEERKLLANAKTGEVFLHHLTPKTGLRISSGLIHDWVAGIFIKGTSLKEAQELVVDFDRHKRVYPDVLESATIAKSGNLRKGYLRLSKKKVLTVVLNSEYEVRSFDAGANRKYTVSHSTKIAEVDDPGSKKERDLPAGEGHGFLWRLYAYWRFEAAPDGVYAECQAISLTRDVPAALAWMVNPFIQDMPKESLRTTLEATRAALAR